MNLHGQQINQVKNSMGTFEIFVTEMFIEYSSMFHMTFVQIAEFNWLPERQKG